MRKTIKIFLASSMTELREERDQLEIFIRNISDEFEQNYDVKIVPLRCENVDPCMSKLRKQEEFNDMIRGCDMCFFLFYTRAGAATQEEFDVAFEQLKSSATNKPKIYVYFKNLPSGVAVDKSIGDFKQKVANVYRHYFGTFDHIDTIKLRILLNLKIQEMDFVNIEINDNWCSVDGKNVLRLENISEFLNNKELRMLKAELADVEQKYLEMKPIYEQGDIDDDFRRQYVQIAAKRQNLLELIDELQKRIFELSLNLSKDEVRGNITPRMKEAYRLFELGDNFGCLSILNADDIDGEFERWEKMRAREGKVKADIYIREHKLAIDILQTMYTYDLRTEEIEKRYEKIVEAAEKYEVDLNVALDYVNWLVEYNNFEKAISVAQKLKECYERVGADTKDKVALYCYLGANYEIGKQYKQAYENYKRALELWKEKSKTKMTDDELCELANFYEQLGLFAASLPAELSDIVDMQNGSEDGIQASRLSASARRMKKNLENFNGIDFTPLKYTAWHTFASGEMDKYINARRVDGAATLPQDADSETDFVYTNPIMESAELVMYAFCIRAKLLEKSENFFKYAKGMTLTMGNIANIAGMLKSSNDFIVAITKQAIYYLEVIAKQKPELDLRPDFAYHYHTLGVIAFEMGDHERSKVYMDKTIDLFKQCAHEDPSKYDIKLANALYSVADMYFEQDRRLSKTLFEQCAAVLGDIYNVGDLKKETYLFRFVDCNLKLFDLHMMFEELADRDEAIELLNRARSLANEFASMQEKNETEFLLTELRINCRIPFANLPHSSEQLEPCLQAMRRAVDRCEKLSRPNISYSYSYWREMLGAFVQINDDIVAACSSDPQFVAEWRKAYFALLDEIFVWMAKNVLSDPLSLLPPQFRNMSRYAFFAPDMNFLELYFTLLMSLYGNMRNVDPENESAVSKINDKFDALYSAVLCNANRNAPNKYLIAILKKEQNCFK